MDTTKLAVIKFAAAAGAEDAVETLRAAWGAADDAEDETLALDTGLAEIVAAGVAALGLKTKLERYEADVAALTPDALFVQFLETVTAKGYFKDCAEGSREYRERFSKVATKYRTKMAARGGGGAAAPAAAAPAGGAGDVAAAEKLKAEGNLAVAAKEYDRAIELYTGAIEASPAGPSTHIYYSNRAAARCHVNEYDLAVDDCEASIGLNSSYAKAYSRLGFAHFYLEDHEAAVQAYEKSLKLDPGNKVTKQCVGRWRYRGAAAAAAPTTHDCVPPTPYCCCCCCHNHT